MVVASQEPETARALPTLTGRPNPELAQLIESVLAARGDLGRYLVLADAAADLLPAPGSGNTGRRFEVLAAIAAADLTAARVVEAHVDALAILAEADVATISLPGAAAGSSWGVFAAEGPGPDGRPTRLDATEQAGAWQLTGRKVWCSLADSLSHALVTAHTPAGRRLFAVDLRQAGVVCHPGDWVARGLPLVTSGPVDFDRVPAVPVGEAGWYLIRPGFAWGGIGVAACWWGGAVGVARTLWRGAAARQDNDLTMMHLGAVDAALSTARLSLLAAAAEIDAGTAGVTTVERVRSTVVDAAELVLHRVGHALGPAPLALDERHAGAVADLGLYIRQHHGEKDLARLGRAVTEQKVAPW